MERFDVHVAAESQRSLTTKDTKNTEKILFRLRDLCDLCGKKLFNEKVRDGDLTLQLLRRAKGRHRQVRVPPLVLLAPRLRRAYYL
ncbi:MAG: hypothetical protein DME82_06185 [Verrucomicrobia bacterium]|nr:MAG: hypothetical protein DME82_06185 [Verrucomicrobiota bacterium]